MNASRLQINKELVLSTAHIPQWLAQAMDNEIRSPHTADARIENVAFDRVDSGYLVYVPQHPQVSDNDTDFPEELQPAIKLARDNDCIWLRFDCDASTVDGLPKWEW